MVAGSESPGSDFYISTFFGPFSVNENARSSYRLVSPRKTARVEVATSRIGAQGILVETGAGCQERCEPDRGCLSLELFRSTRQLDPRNPS
jgi:hypothetical protein